MSAVSRDSGLPGFLAPRLEFSFYEQSEAVAPAPVIYEAWRVQDLIGDASGWFYCKPTAQLIEAMDYADAYFKIDWSREMVGLHDECVEDGVAVWQKKRPWWLS